MPRNAVGNRFEARPFEDTYIPVPESGCWISTHCWNEDGYGRTGKKPRLAHRLSYEIHYGPIPAGLLVCHRCDTPSCVNPDHLFLGTDKENTQDCKRKGRLRRSPGELNGSSVLTEENVLEIRSSELTAKALAVKFGVTPPSIYKARTGFTWAHVGGLK